MISRAAGLGIAVAALFALHAAVLAGVAEDAFITFRFARNLVAGAGLVWNPGEAPVEGYTNFLWLLISAGFQLLSLDAPRWAQLTGVAASLVTLAYTYRAARTLLGWSTEMALLPCLCLALSGPFATWAAAGLETNAFGALLVVAVYHVAAYASSGRRLDLQLGFGALLLACLTRPEGILVYAVVLGSLSVSAVRDGSRRVPRDLAAPVLATLTLLGLLEAWRWSYFGYPLPNTFYAKTGGGAALYLRGSRYAGLFALHYLVPWLPLLLLGVLARRSGTSQSPATAATAVSWPSPPSLLLICAGVLGSYSLAIVWLGGDYMAMYRFFVPVLPFLYLLLAEVLRRVRVWEGGERAQARARVALGIALLGTLIHSTPFEAVLFAAPQNMHGNWRGVVTERWHVARLTRIASFFAERAAGADQSIGTDAIGAIGWYSGLRVFGLHGLVDPAIAHATEKHSEIGSSWAGHDRKDWARLFAREPTYVMLSRTVSAKPPQRVGLEKEIDSHILQQYELVSVWLEDPVNGEAGYFSFLERRRAPARRVSSKPGG